MTTVLPHNCLPKKRLFCLSSLCIAQAFPCWKDPVSGPSVAGSTGG